MTGAGDISEVRRPGRNRLFDQDGLPWTSRVHWGIPLFWVAAVLFILASIVGIYLGLWLISKGRPALSLSLYLAMAFLSVPVFFVPFPASGSITESILALSFLILWLVGAFVLRREVMRYYSSREGVPFPLNPGLTLLFGPWYVGGHLRADFPLDDSGKVGTGVMKLVV